MAKVGEGHVAAMGRLGLHELRGMMYPESNIAQRAEYGLYGTRTPGEVAEARRDDPGLQMGAGDDGPAHSPEPSIRGGIEDGPPMPEIDL
jgi:hypothetical protein